MADLQEALRQFTLATTNKEGETLPYSRRDYFARALIKFITDLI